MPNSYSKPVVKSPQTDTPPFNPNVDPEFEEEQRQMEVKLRPVPKQTILTRAEQINNMYIVPLLNFLLTMVFKLMNMVVKRIPTYLYTLISDKYMSAERKQRYDALLKKYAPHAHKLDVMNEEKFGELCQAVTNATLAVLNVLPLPVQNILTASRSGLCILIALAFAIGLSYLLYETMYYITSASIGPVSYVLSTVVSILYNILFRIGGILLAIIAAAGIVYLLRAVFSHLSSILQARQAAANSKVHAE